MQLEIKQLGEATGTPEQIRVSVQMLEVVLTKLRNKGVSTTWFANGYVRPADIRPVLDTIREQVNPSYSHTENLTETLQFVNWLRQQNLAKPVANPTIVVASGKSASIHVGGEFPVPATGDSNAGLVFRRFGTELSVEAISLGDNQVRLELKSRVSEIDESHPLEVGGNRVPGLRITECSTGCELPFGETALLAGLVQQRVEARKNDEGKITETIVDVGLLVVATPELVQLARASAVHASDESKAVNSQLAVIARQLPRTKSFKDFVMPCLPNVHRSGSCYDH